MRVRDCGASCLLALVFLLDKAASRAIKQIAPHRPAFANCHSCARYGATAVRRQQRVTGANSDSSSCMGRQIRLFQKEKPAVVVNSELIPFG